MKVTQKVIFNFNNFNPHFRISLCHEHRAICLTDSLTFFISFLNYPTFPLKPYRTFFTLFYDMLDLFSGGGCVGNRGGGACME